MISIVIPTQNEAARLPGLLARLSAEPKRHEVIVVDGGSQDETVSVARANGAHVLYTSASRGKQLVRGAAAATGDTLLFLHADSGFPQGGLAQIERALSDNPDCPGGNFRLVFDGGSSFAIWLTGFYAWIRAHGVYYGDSGIFVRRDVYDDMGGIRPIDLMEDFDFTRRLERAGPTCCIEEPPLVTSSRRFEGRSSFAVFCGWLQLHALFYLKAPSGLLARQYAWQCRRTQRRLSNINGVD